MKVIGRTQNGLIVEASISEMCSVCGFDYESERRDARNKAEARNGYSRKDAFEIGDDIQVNALFGMIRGIQGHDRKLTEAKAMLQAVISGVEMVQPVIRTIKATGEEAALESPVTVP